MKKSIIIPKEIIKFLIEVPDYSYKILKIILFIYLINILFKFIDLNNFKSMAEDGGIISNLFDEKNDKIINIPGTNIDIEIGN